MSATIKYKGIETPVASGEKATLPVANLKMASNIEVKVEDSDIPEYTEVAGFTVFLDEFDGGTCTVGYTAPQDVKLPKGTHRLASVDYGGESPSSPSIETGTLTLYDGNGYNFEIIYPRYRADGSIISVQETYHGDGDGDAVFNNIPLGAPVVMYFPGRDGIDDGDLQGLSEINFSSYLPSCRVFKLTASTAAAYFL